jgi:competence protein ComEA
MFVSTERLARVGPRQVLGAVAALLAVGCAAGWAALHGAAAAAPSPPPAVDAASAPAPATVLVFVSGAVAHPGLYELSPDARVADALAAAGGMTPLADPGHLPNLAARVHDGRQVNVPYLKTTSGAAAKLDINTAAEDELGAVPGMPPGLAAEIVQQRDQWGPFTSISQLRTDFGVDAATVAGLGHYLRVVAPPP